MTKRSSSKSTATAVRAHRRRLKSRGMARVELNVDRRDVALVRDVATALADPARRDAARSVLARNFGAPAAPSLKA
ncbi:MAG: hypothetical protein JNL07_11865, partial [Rhodospirillales bacterium]|nr:hypothetical protein [Rhodospirillales bacterium]